MRGNLQTERNMLDSDIILHICASTYESHPSISVPFHSTRCLLPSLHLHLPTEVHSSTCVLASTHPGVSFYVCTCLHPSRCCFPWVYLPLPVQVHLSMCVLASTHWDDLLHLCTFPLTEMCHMSLYLLPVWKSKHTLSFLLSLKPLRSNSSHTIPLC